MATPEQRLVTEAKLADELAGKAAASHTHPQSEVVGLEAKLATYDRDTGWRDLSSLLSGGWTGRVAGRRIGQFVHLVFAINGTNASQSTIFTLPVMFAPSIPAPTSDLRVRFPLDPVISGDDPGVGEVVWIGIDGTTVAAEEYPRTSQARTYTSYMTTQVWDTSFPGTPL